MAIHIWQDDDGFHATYNCLDGSEGKLHEKELIGMTCLVKQCLTSQERFYRPPDGVEGQPIPKDQIDWLENRAIRCLADDLFMY